MADRPTARVAPPSDPSAKLLRPEDQLDRLISELARLKELLRQSQRLASLGTAAAMLAHEYNNLFTPIVGYARHALDRDDPELMKTALEKVLKQSANLTIMSGRILGLAVEHDHMPGPCELLPIVENAVGCLGRDLAKDRISLNIQIDPQLRVRVNPQQLEQVLFNLITNARQAMLGRAGRLSIDAVPAGGEGVRICVRDTGPGIGAENLERIFDPFFTTKPQVGPPGSCGIGLGLYICRELMRDNAGTISVQSTPGQGACFTLELPSGN